jgi:hypothetical protein
MKIKFNSMVCEIEDCTHCPHFEIIKTNAKHNITNKPIYAFKCNRLEEDEQGTFYGCLPSDLQHCPIEVK